MIKKTIFALVLFLLANTVNASVLIEWGPNPTTEQIFQYTLYWQKDGDVKSLKSQIVTATPTPGLSLSENDFEVGANYIFTVSAWNYNLNGTPREGPQSAPGYYVGGSKPPVDENLPDAPTGIGITITKPVIEDTTP